MNWTDYIPFWCFGRDPDDTHDHLVKWEDIGIHWRQPLCSGSTGLAFQEVEPTPGAMCYWCAKRAQDLGIAHAGSSSETGVTTWYAGGYRERRIMPPIYGSEYRA